MNLIPERNVPPVAPRRWSPAPGAWVARPAVRLAARTLLYLMILIGLLLIYGRGDFSTPPFIYQGF